MSNPNFPFGLNPVQHIDGSPWNGQTMRCYLPVGLSGAYYVGDPVTMAGSADTLGTSPTITIALAGAGYSILGVITSFEPVDPTGSDVSSNLNLQITYRPTLTAMYCQVCTDPTAVYEVMGDVDAVIAATDVGNVFNLAAGGGGSTTTGLSSWVLDSDSKTAAVSNYQAILWSASPDVSNDISSIYAKWLVFINLRQLFSPGVSSITTPVYAGGLGVS